MRIAVLGAGISGLGSAYLLSKEHEVDVYESEDRLGGHARTTMVHEMDNSFGVDTGFLVFNHATYPLLTKLFNELDVSIENSDMSFGFWDVDKNIAYNGQTLKGLFFQKKNLFSFGHYRMIFDIIRFNKKANKDLDTNGQDLGLSLKEYLQTFSIPFKERYILPMGAAIWSTPAHKMDDFPAKSFLQFFKNHGLLGVTTQHQWLTVSNGSIQYVEKIAKKISGRVVLNSDVVGVQREDNGVYLVHKDGHKSHYDKVVMAMHAPDALSLLENPSEQETAILSSFSYKDNDATLHRDTNALYPDKKIYAAWNYKNDGDSNSVSLSYWINRLQNLKTKNEYFVSLNERKELSNVIEHIRYSHPQFDAVAIKAQCLKNTISGHNHTFYAGAYWRFGFHEDGLWSANEIAKSLGCEL